MDFRNYDPAIGRFHSADPLGELTPDWTPYRFAFNNPIFFNDPTGLCEGCEDAGFIYRDPDAPADNNFFQDLFQGYYGVNWDALATGDWSQGDMNDNFGGEGYEFADLGADYNYSDSPDSGEICLPCFIVPIVLFGGGTMRNSTGNPDVDHAAIDKSVALQRDAMVIAAPLPKLNLALGVSYGFGKYSSIIYRFGGDEAINHFAKHGKSVMDALGKNSYNLKNYIDDANFIIKNGTYVPELHGYVRLIGGQGSAKYGFVGLDRLAGTITTFHIKTAKELSKKAPNMFNY